MQMAEGRQVYSPPPSKLPRLSGTDPNDGAHQYAGPGTAAPPPPGPGLGLGLGDSSGSDAEASGATRETRPSTLTFTQRQELEHQVLIYRYLAAGAPVPVHLVLPIWKSVAASSFGPQSFPSLMGLGSLCFHYRSSLEPESGRCRRTDGKKWRCSRNTVPGHKYCERHVHCGRGRGRSRKPVEATSAAAAAPAVPIRPVHAAAAQATNAHAPSPPRLGFPSNGVVLAHSTGRAT